jgi:hypothetical protein
MCNYSFARCVAISTAKGVMQLKFQSYQLNSKSKAHNQGSNINAEAKEEIEMQTPIDDSGIFTEVSRSVQASPKSSLEPLARKPLQGASSWSGNSIDSLRPSPHASGSPCSFR